jgi:threonine/homoserine/homoserine lactone efflux protein
MPSLQHLVPFLLATIVFAYLPGPGMLYAAAQTMARGRAGGLMASLGLHLGGYLHVALAAFGLAAALHYVPSLYLAVKLAGAAYLVWVGLGLLRRSVAAGEMLALPAAGPRRAFLQSVTVEMLNPKTAIFFVAFLPQFVDPAAALPVWAQLLLLGTLVNLCFSSADVAVTLAAAAVLRRLRRTGAAQRVVGAMGGSLLIGLGVRLAIARD